MNNMNKPNFVEIDENTINIQIDGNTLLILIRNNPTLKLNDWQICNVAKEQIKSYGNSANEILAMPGRKTKRTMKTVAKLILKENNLLTCRTAKT